MTLQSVLMALCLLCTPATAKTEAHPELECYSSPAQLYQAQGTHKWKRHRTPSGMCYHSGPKNHSGVFVHIQSPPQKEKYSASSRSPKTTSSGSGTKTWGANAKPVPHQFNVDDMAAQWKHYRFLYDGRP
jgi:hypothetical protein